MSLVKRMTMPLLPLGPQLGDPVATNAQRTAETGWQLLLIFSKVGIQKRMLRTLCNRYKPNLETCLTNLQQTSSCQEQALLPSGNPRHL